MHGRPFLGKNRPQPRQYVFGVRDRHDETLETTRWIDDGRYHLIRNYRTNVSADQQTLTSRYNSASELCQEIRALKATGKLNPIQQLLWGDSRPRVMLFDGKTDPWCLKNLAEDPAHREMRERLLTALNKYLLENRDLGFWPEPDLADAEKKAPAYTLARTTDRYPLERILQTTNLTDAAELIERLGDSQLILKGVFMIRFVISLLLNRRVRSIATVFGVVLATGMASAQTLRKFDAEVHTFDAQSGVVTVSAVPDSGKRWELRITPETKFTSDRELPFAEVPLGVPVGVTGTLMKQGERYKSHAEVFTEDTLCVQEVRFVRGSDKAPAGRSLATGRLLRENERLYIEGDQGRLLVRRGFNDAANPYVWQVDEPGTECLNDDESASCE